MRGNTFFRLLPTVGAALALLLWPNIVLSLTAATYDPLAPGNSWTYSIEGTFNTESTTVSADKVWFDGVWAYELADSDGSKGYALIDQDGYKAYGGYLANGVTSYIFSPIALNLPANFEVGQSFTQSATATYLTQGVAVASASVSFTRNIIGFEHVSVPAGTFYAVRVDSSFTISITNISTGATATETAFDSSWLAENVGEVKSINYGSDGTTSSRALQQYSVTPYILPSYELGSIQIDVGWNLVGNGSTTPIYIASRPFSDPAMVNTVWKWNHLASRWAFYSPSLSAQALADYAASKGYDVLTTIDGGEGFWVNALQSATVPLPPGLRVMSAEFREGRSRALSSGWNLISVADGISPQQFDLDTPGSGAIPGQPATQHFTTFWMWVRTSGQWLFYAPSLWAQGIDAYLKYCASMGYLDFLITANNAVPGVGFWVNKP